MNARTFLTPEAQRTLVEAIGQAERRTAGEIRVHIEDSLPSKKAPLVRAAEVFEKLGMHATEAHNGCLIYVAVKDHKLAIAGDAGINALVPEHFWEETVARVIAHFKEARYAQGLIEAVGEVAEKLALHFPATERSSSENELSDDISFGDDENDKNEEGKK